MNAGLEAQLANGAGAWFDANRDQILDALMDLVRIPSVSGPYQPQCTHPFGEGCAQVVDAACDLARSWGLSATNHDYYAASAWVEAAGAGGAVAGGATGSPAAAELAEPGEVDGVDGPDVADSLVAGAAGAGEPASAGASAPDSIAFYSHLDVVAAGEGWSHDPFAPFVEGGFVHGRGSNDNKGPAVAVLAAMRYLLEGGWRPRCSWKLYLGANEESDMQCIRHLMRTCGPATVNLVSDAAFPVCVGEKGNVMAQISVPLNDPALLAFAGGNAPNIVPGACGFAVAGGLEQGEGAGPAAVTITAGEGSTSVHVEGLATHAARPEGSVNAVAAACALAAAAPALLAETRAAFAFLAQAFAGHDGAQLGIAAQHSVMGATTCVLTQACYDHGQLLLGVNVRYPVGLTSDQVVAHMGAALPGGFSLVCTSAAPAFMRSAEAPLVQRLTGIVSQVKGAPLQPYTMGGGTYAKWIDGAVGFGAADPSFASPFGPGRGGAHEPDEVMAVSDLRDAFVVYVHALMALDSDPSLRQ